MTKKKSIITKKRRNTRNQMKGGKSTHKKYGILPQIGSMQDTTSINEIEDPIGGVETKTDEEDK